MTWYVPLDLAGNNARPGGAKGEPAARSEQQARQGLDRVEGERGGDGGGSGDPRLLEGDGHPGSGPAPPGAIGSALAAAIAERPTKAEANGLGTPSAASTAAPAASRADADSVTHASSVADGLVAAPNRPSRRRPIARTAAQTIGATSSQTGRPAEAPATHISA
jgi:hypothetical protein